MGQWRARAWVVWTAWTVAQCTRDEPTPSPHVERAPHANTPTAAENAELKRAFERRERESHWRGGHESWLVDEVLGHLRPLRWLPPVLPARATWSLRGAEGLGIVVTPHVTEDASLAISLSWSVPSGQELDLPRTLAHTVLELTHEGVTSRLRFNACRLAPLSHELVVRVVSSAERAPVSSTSHVPWVVRPRLGPGKYAVRAQSGVMLRGTTGPTFRAHVDAPFQVHARGFWNALEHRAHALLDRALPRSLSAFVRRGDLKVSHDGRMITRFDVGERHAFGIVQSATGRPLGLTRELYCEPYSGHGTCGVGADRTQNRCLVDPRESLPSRALLSCQPLPRRRKQASPLKDECEPNDPLCGL